MEKIKLKIIDFINRFYKKSEKKKVNLTSQMDRLSKIAGKYNCKHCSIHTNMTTGFYSDGSPIDQTTFSVFVSEQVTSIISFNCCHTEDLEFAFNDIENKLKNHFNKKEDVKLEIEI